MRSPILPILAATLFAVSTAQLSAAAEHHRSQKTNHVSAPASEHFRNARAYARPSAPVDSDWSRYENGAASGSAGR
jgi:hypothetical protein